MDYLDFLDACPTSFHAAREVAAWCERVGVDYLVRDGAVVAWVVPENPRGFRIVGAHTDSPSLKLKPTQSFSHGFGQLDVEVYGGALLNSWLDRELLVAGRVVEGDEERLVRTAPLARIPQLAIHLDRDVNKGLTLDPQRHIHPVWTDDPDASLRDFVGEGSFELFLHPAQPAGTFGSDQQFVASGRQDNLSSVFAGVSALSRLGDVQSAVVFVANDHEEVGSASRTGAGGPLLEEVLRRIAWDLGRSDREYVEMLSRSVCLSCDAAHGVHPNYSDRHDPSSQPMLGKGPVLKINANQRYATDAVGMEVWNKACSAAGVDSQVFVSNNAMPCGSTIGPITSTRLGIRTIDAGIPLLSMHSTREMSHGDDVDSLSKVIEQFWLG